jgi:hypothetical protein
MYMLKLSGQPEFAYIIPEKLSSLLMPNHEDPEKRTNFICVVFSPAPGK